MSIEQKNKSAVASLESASPVVGNANAEYFPHHPIADLFPALAEKELAELAGDIAANGQREPGVVWNGLLLEGKNRQLACIRKNIPFQTVKAAAKKLRDLKKGSRKSRERKLPVNSLPNRKSASSSEQTVVTPSDAEIDRASRIFFDANAAYPECNGLAFRLLECKHPGEAAETWRSVEEFASKMRHAYERLDERLDEKLNTGKPSV